MIGYKYVGNKKLAMSWTSEFKEAENEKVILQNKRSEIRSEVRLEIRSEVRSKDQV